MVHRPVLGVVAALGLVVKGVLAEALLRHHEGVILITLLAGTGEGDAGAIHELGVFCPVEVADPAAALHLAGGGDRVLEPTARSTGGFLDRSSGLPCPGLPLDSHPPPRSQPNPQD